MYFKLFFVYFSIWSVSDLMKTSFRTFVYAFYAVTVCYVLKQTIQPKKDYIARYVRIVLYTDLQSIIMLKGTCMRLWLAKHDGVQGGSQKQLCFKMSSVLRAPSSHNTGSLTIFVTFNVCNVLCKDSVWSQIIATVNIGAHFSLLLYKTSTCTVYNVQL